MTPWLEILYPASSPLPSHAAAKGEPAFPPPFAGSPQPMDGEPQLDAAERGKSALPMRSQGISPSYPFCLTCKRTLIPGALYADGFRDGAEKCHHCKRDAFERSFVEAEEELP